MSWFSVFFKKDSVKVFLDLALKILKLLLGNVADNLSKIAQEEVARAEKTGKTGDDKYKIAFDGIKTRLPEVKNSAINLAIELAVNALMAAKG